MPALRNLRSRSRAAVRNDPYAANVIDKRVSNLIGTGITPQPRLIDKALRKVMQVLWEDWVDESDADELTDFTASRRWWRERSSSRASVSCGCVLGVSKMTWRCRCSCNVSRPSSCHTISLK